MHARTRESWRQAASRLSRTAYLGGNCTGTSFVSEGTTDVFFCGHDLKLYRAHMCSWRIWSNNGFAPDGSRGAHASDGLCFAQCLLRNVLFCTYRSKRCHKPDISQKLRRWLLEDLGAVRARPIAARHHNNSQVVGRGVDGDREKHQLESAASGELRWFFAAGSGWG